MTTRMTINGVSTCQTAGTEKYEKYQTTIRRKRTTLFQYDYRHTDGELFSCVRPTLEECRHLRDEWIKGKEDRGGQIMTAYYDTLIVTFSDTIRILDMMCTDACDVATLKEWIESYESTRMTPINEHTAVITSEYRKYTPIAEMKEY